ncbi:MAG: fructose-6-phosphate aldolase [Acidobacteria bacterium]|nr:fructose-6-phosphate aldolase [Acidobacteriota bacterium]MCI0567440.1 fructose-6-phosphate aldolase [Acidobacteriota bacterium]
MKFFIDTANIQEIKKSASWGILDGVTTNPSLAAKEGKDFIELLKEICAVVPGPVSAEVVSTTTEEMVKEGRELSRIAKNITVKIPCIAAGIPAIKALSSEGIPINTTLIFSSTQALIAAKAGATYVSPFVGRLDDISFVGMDVVRQIRTIFDNYNFPTQILAASIRNPVHVVEAALAGSDVATMPFAVIEALVKHPLTDVGLKKFLDDWQKLSQPARRG